MFKIDRSPEFTLDVPIPEPGAEDQPTIKARFRAVSEERLNAADWLDVESIKEFLRDVILELSDVVDEAGEAVPFGRELLDRVLAIPYARVGLMRAYGEALSGLRRGN